jgi:tRNA modification GTPase
MYAEDTIAAIATPPGAGGIGIIRVSGPAAEAIADAIFSRRSLTPWASHQLYHGRVVRADGTAIDDGLAVLMRAPRSYTGEDVLEIHCHGSPAVLRLVLQRVMELGARPAAPGEFTKRAFLNGKLDLTQAEAVADLVRARTAEGTVQAADQLFGRLSERLDALRQQLLHAKACLELRIDFSEEDVDPRQAAPDDALLRSLLEIDALLATYRRGKLLREGVRVAITGRPNVGKSSLLNALLGTERAIVTALPGTTRDVIEDSADFDGLAVVLSDTAGLREAPGEIERVGIERAHRVARAADLTLIVLDTSVPLDEPSELLDMERTILVLNKIDLPSAWDEADLSPQAKRYPLVRVSAKELIGLEGLRRRVVETLGASQNDGLPPLTTARQRDALVQARESVVRALEGLEKNLAPELVAVDVAAALDQIGSITGAVTNEDVLDAIFREFCIGK